MSLNSREKTSFILSISVHVAVIGMMTYGLFSAPSLPEPPQGEIAIDFDLSGGFNNLTLDKSAENISKKPIEKTAGKQPEADVGQKEIVQKIAAEKKKQEEEKKKRAEKRKQELKKKKIAEQKKLKDKRKKDLAEKKKREEKRKKDLAEKKKEEAERKKKLAEKKRREEAEKKKQQALLEKKKKEEGQKKRFDDSRIANLLKSKENNKATQQKSSGTSKDPVGDILSKQSSEKTGVAGKEGKKNAASAHKLGGGLAWSDKSAIINALRPCWERYQGIAKGNVTVDFSIDNSGYLKGAVKYVFGDRSAFAGAKRAVPECASPLRGISADKLSKLDGGLRVTFTPLDVRL